MNVGKERPQADARLAAEETMWQWPLDLTGYDRTSTLTTREHEALVALGWDLRRARPYDRGRPEWKAIDRLLRPLDAARLAVIVPADRYYQRGGYDAIALILRACSSKQTAFWGWSPTDWMDVFGASQRALDDASPGWLESGARSTMVAIAYLLGCFTNFGLLGSFNRITLATRIFGAERVQAAIATIMQPLTAWGYHEQTNTYPQVVCTLLLLNRSPDLTAMTTPQIQALRLDLRLTANERSALYAIQRVLAEQGQVALPTRHTSPPQVPLVGVPPAWEAWVERWVATSTLTLRVRQIARVVLFKVGRWLAIEHPTMIEPAAWTRDLCAAFLSMVEQLRIGDYTQRREPFQKRLGHPLSAQAKAGYISAVRGFFRDCQEWEWIPRRFDPARSLATPRRIRALTGPDPRVIADDIWAKLLWAGINLTSNDLPKTGKWQCYPLEFVQALALVWLFGGLRSDEIVRLRVGCIRWQANQPATGSGDGKTTVEAGTETVCLLDVPINKTGAAFTKPVDPMLGKAILTWERHRPTQPAMVDRKTGERVHFLFCYRARSLTQAYLNHVLIPMLCGKAGIPLDDVRGRITSHRARATIASQLYNAKDPMTLFELQAWLGHRSAETTQHYAKITPNTLTKAYTEADYFARNVRTIEVLIDRAAIETGAAAAGTPWQYFDLGHGYCSYNFFEQCAHRMACARCTFYLPKDSSKFQLLEAKASLQRMLLSIPLTEEERAAVEQDAAALDRLLARLADVPTPAGLTPRQIGTHEGQEIIPLLAD